MIALLRSNSSSYLQRKANYAAYAALQRCLSELDKTTIYQGEGGRYVSTWDPGTTLTKVPVPGEPDVFYTIRVTNNSRGNLGNQCVAEDGNLVPVGLIYLRVTTQARPGGNQRGRTYSADVASLTYIGQINWQHVILGSRRVLLANQSRVDAFDSREPVAYLEQPELASQDSVATVASNGTIRSIQLLEGSRVSGKVRWGPEGIKEQALLCDNTSQITGPASANTQLFRIPRFRPPYHPDLATRDITVPPNQTLVLEPGAYRSAKVSPGAHLVLKTGRYSQPTSVPQYYFDQSLVVQSGMLELDDSDAESRVEIYVGETLEVKDGGQVNPWRNTGQGGSQRMQILFVGNGSVNSPQRFTVDRSSLVWALAAGRGMSFSLDHGSHFFGAVRAYEVTLDHASEAHWDRAITSDSRIRGKIAWSLQGLFDEVLEDGLNLGQPQEQESSTGN